MSESAEKALAQVRFEIEQTDKLLQVYSDLLDDAERHSPTLVETTALASVLHSFYNGLESTFLSVAKCIDQNVPAGQHWHRDLLMQVSHPAPARPAVISEGLADTLTDYLAFRHFYRHSYSFILDWSELERLVRPLRQVWSQVRTELLVFLDTVS